MFEEGKKGKTTWQISRTKMKRKNELRRRAVERKFDQEKKTRSKGLSQQEEEIKTRDSREGRRKSGELMSRTEDKIQSEKILENG